MSEYVVIREHPNVVKLEDENGVFGKVEELTSGALGAQGANMARVTLWGPDMIHAHKKAEETYVCILGHGQILLNDEVLPFSPGVRVIIRPGTFHAVRPIRSQIVFHCVASPPFDPKDIMKELGRWSSYVEESKEW